MRLTKHHGLGNDFLVALLEADPGPEAARWLCDRRRGVGADGFIVGLAPVAAGTDAVMVLYNSDGSRAAMSGNGIRCLAQAVAADRGMGDASLVIDTDAGTRAVIVRSGPGASSVTVEVDMGPVADGPPWHPGPDTCAALAQLGGGAEVRLGTADIGNPHLVVQVPDPWSVDVAAVGPRLESAVPGGINVELIAPTPRRGDELDLVVWERGAGVTAACGTGASAAAALAHRWGLVGERVRVHMPGGDVEVVVGPHVTLVGPATYVARIEVDLG